MLEWPSLAELRERRSYKWRLHGDDVLPAFVAEMDVLLPPPVRTAIQHAAATGDTGYAYGADALRTALAAFAARRHGWMIDPGDIALVPDVMGGVLEVLRRVARPGEGVVITPPVYAPFFEHIEEAGCEVVEAPLSRDGARYTIDLEALDRALQRSHVLLLCNPHNPTGRVFTRRELEEVLAVAVRRDTLVLCDEVHAPLVLRGARHVPFANLGDEAAGRTLTFVSASKAWNIPGLKCAQVVAQSPRMRAVLAALGERLTWRTGHLGVLASAAAYRDGVGWLDELVLHIERMHTLFGELLTDMPVHRIPAEATYVSWLDCSELDWGDDPAARFLAGGRVALDSGLKYGSAGAGFARATLGTSETIVREIATRMHQAVNA